MTPEFAQSPFLEDTHQAKNVRNTTITYLAKRLRPFSTVLDIGPRSPLSQDISLKLFADVINTHGDLDTIDLIYNTPYDFILYSHTIEHQYNPLHTLLEIRKVMTPDTTLFIVLPSRGKLLWAKGHFHEIDRYRMTLLLKRAGMLVVGYERHKVWREWWFYLTGVRPLMRLFFEFNAYYEVKI